MTDASSPLEPVMSNDNEIKSAALVTSILYQKAIEIRQRLDTWQSYRTSLVITDDDFKFITTYEAVPSENRSEFLQNNGCQTVKTFFSLLSNLSGEPMTQYVLCLIDEMLLEQKTRVAIFHNYCVANKISLFEKFHPLLLREDSFVQNMAALLIAKCACWSTDHRLTGTDLSIYLIWLIEQLNIQDNEYIQTIARCLQLMLRIDDYRDSFVQLDGLAVVFNALKARTNFQILYQLIFCLWICTFDPDLTLRMNLYNAVPKLADILSGSIKEKVIRMILATFRNLIEKPAENEPDVARENAITMVQCKVLKHLEILQQSGQKFDDPDILEDIEFLHDKLQTFVHDLSSFDEYSTEIRSGCLKWSPVHTSEKFWRENAARFNEKDHELLRLLIRLLKISADSLVLSVAAHDLGEYVRYYPRGKMVSENLGGKEPVMRLLAHNDTNVRYEALLCVQKLMVQNWQYLGKQLEKDTKKEVPVNEVNEVNNPC